ncbi:MAG: hypothetical protein ACYSTF_02335 [Planctomycetota bacterium]|jgi:hypothetical protein
MNIATLAFDMAKVVEVFVQNARRFFYSVMLLGYRCPKCRGLLKIVAEGVCRCNRCGHELDPTVQFQKCSACDGTPVLRARRYKCNKCGSDIRSKFLFDGLVFDAGYFREKMTESRQRKKEKREQVRMMLADCRSPAMSLGIADLASVPGLEDALNSLTAGLSSNFEIESRTEFNLKRYEEHIKAHIQDFPVSLDEIPPLSEENTRKDLIWRFIALIFMAHAGVVNIWQDGPDIMVIRNETNREGQDVFGEPEEVDGIEGSVGGIEAW